jgi:hypothetical protein
MENDHANTGMAWSIKASFLSYLSQTGDAHSSISDGAAFTSSGEYYFPLHSQDDFDAETLTGRVKFQGKLQFTAHMGMLNVVIGNPVVVFEKGSAQLFIDRTDYAGARSRQQPLVLIDAGEPVADGDALMWRYAPTSLAPEALDLFGGVYRTGEAFDPITLRIEGKQGDHAASGPA